MQDPKKRNWQKEKSSGGAFTEETLPRDPWLPLLATLPLSRTEKEVVRRYETDLNGRAFLPVADILRSHRLQDESLELLTQGVERHPSFTVARVVLSRELLQKGLVAESWRVLEESPVSLRDNLLAQKLRFRLAMLLGEEGQVRSTFQHLTMHQMLDAETKRLGDLLELAGLEKAREKLLKDLKERGITPVIPPVQPVEMTSVGSSSGKSQLPPLPQTPQRGSGGLPVDVLEELFGEEPDVEEARLAAFHVVPLNEIFRTGDGDRKGESMGDRANVGASPSAAGNLGNASLSGIELDSTTLADIYAKQGHYTRALAVYRRLLRLTPNNELLRRRLTELARLEKEQRDVDLTIDPALVDRMEAVEIIDRQIKFYNGLLSRLS